MNHTSLNGQWSLFKSHETTAIAATVPGCVHTALIANGLLEDPFYRDNELRQMWVGETDWHYSRTFTMAADVLTHDRVLLRCLGLDTIATLHLNGVEIGQADNMHRTWEFDIKPSLHAGENTLDIVFAAPMEYARHMDETKGALAGWVEPMRINSGAWIRKEPCNFGWDWGPKMVTSGIWRDIEIIAYDTARLSDVLVTQQHSDHQVGLTVSITAKRGTDTPVTATVTVSKDGQVVASAENVAFAGESAECALTIHQPEWWWPNNLGAQPLYNIDVTLQDASSQTLDTWAKRIGLRTLLLERHRDDIGESFYFSCNGVPFFAKGANWIPATAYPGNIEAKNYERLVQAAASANMNMLRVWGGGIYEDDVFYDLCDQYGIAIWQDFMFACGTYPAHDAEFMANVKAEAQGVVRRLRHHASIALWCGNNEIEQGMPTPSWMETMGWDNYSLLFDHLLADVVHDLAPQASYWPGSPHTPIGDRNDHSNPTAGDTHLWAVWHRREPFEWYRTRLDRFVSEFGFQSFPEPQITYEFTQPEDRNITSYVMEHHQRSGIGNSTIIHYLLDWFRLPTSFESTIWLSQILQGMAMKYAVEHWRRNMPQTMGTIYWQLNDMWPAPSWSSLDWKGNWKALHHMACRFYAPLLISGLEDMSTNTVTIHVTSDLHTAQAATVVYTITDAAGRTLEQGERAVTIEPRTNLCVETFDLSAHVAAHSARDVLVWLALRVDGQQISENIALLCRPKHLQLVPPHITTTIEAQADHQVSLTLNADAAALYVWLELPNAHFSDNFFHLLPHQPHTVQVTLPHGADAAMIKVQSLVDTYE